MAAIFVSYSSKDKKFATKLASDLERMGHTVWFDEWEIKVGECIPSRIEEGLEGADYVVVVLSQTSVVSGWVDREWKTKYWEEIDTKRTVVLPVLIEECEIPGLLRAKKYADFRDSYPVGLVELASSLFPAVRTRRLVAEIKESALARDVSALLEKVQSRNVPIAQCVAEALEIARHAGNRSLEQFCRNELTGWDREKLEQAGEERPTYRLMEVFISAAAQINLQYFGWGESPSTVFDFMRRDEHFYPWKMLVPQSVGEIESMKNVDLQRAILTMTWRVGDVIPNSKEPDAPLFAYAKTSAYLGILESIRRELTRRLLELLPARGNAG